MKELLQAIKTQLQGDLSYIDDSNIFILPDENLIPATATFPALGLKDGPITRIVETAENWEVHYIAHIIVYVELAEGETPIMGGTNPTVHGVLSIVDDVHGSLNENLLNIIGMELAYSSEEAESETIGYDDLVLQKKRITYEYVKLEERP